MSASDGPCPPGSPEERRDSEPRLEVPDNRTSEPLRVCVKEAVESYFRHLDGHEVSELFDLVMSEVEAPLLETVLAQANGNQSRAAAMLGINRATLRKKLKRYNLI
ncbi:MAG: DNA-binding transcriptional regulator Fis [Gammaproteobacteria bacterium]|nr:DNA-binding transcriptional regulator Fis [Gammaproteobacteria bacterium]